MIKNLNKINNIVVCMKKAFIYVYKKIQVIPA